MNISLQAKRAARNQLLDPGADGVQATDFITPSEMVFLAATGDIPVEDTTHHILEIHHEQDDNETPVLLCTDENPTTNIEIPAIIPEDSSISNKIAERLNMSNYIISPIRKSYNKVFDATTLVLMASRYLLLGTSQNVGKRRVKLANTLLPSACTEHTNQFILGRDDPYGALYQKFKHAQLLDLEQEAETISKYFDKSEEQNQQWSLLTVARTKRLTHLRSGEASPSPEEWSEIVERSINNLSEFINHFKHAQTQANPKEEITAKPTEIRTLLATSF